MSYFWNKLRKVDWDRQVTWWIKCVVSYVALQLIHHWTVQGDAFWVFVAAIILTEIEMGFEGRK